MSPWGRMRGMLLSDEEMGKKDDDHKLASRPATRTQNWNPARGPPRRSLKRIALLLLFAVLVYLFIHNIPTDIGPRVRRPSYSYPDTFGTSSRIASERSGKPTTKGPPELSGQQSLQERAYNGPVRFLELAASLHAISGTRGAQLENKNILFAASSLRSAATLLPVACQMGLELRSFVHFALVSRSEIEMEELRKINGIDETCQIFFHDARPDFASVSTDARMESAVFRAIYHMNVYMHPQAIIIDGSEQEDDFFKKGAQAQARANRITVIELPEGSPKNLMWLTKLDSRSLRAWNQNTIDILIHAIPGGSGSIIRLLKSLSQADYTGCSIPHLTIELPHDIDPPTKQFLKTFKWPPAHIFNPTNARYLSLRHRIPHRSMTEEESSARFLESFWPAHPQQSHILVLSPQVEVSPTFFHYLKYSLLEYGFSSAASLQSWQSRLFGISLETPTTSIDGATDFKPPRAVTENGGQKESPFLWQAPNSNALLFLGEKWTELHDFVSRSLEAAHNLTVTPPLLADKAVSHRYPSWLEHALRLSRARGYWTLYPNADTARNLAEVHTELYRVPEEYVEQAKQAQTSKSGDDQGPQHRAPEVPLGPTSLLESLPDGGSLPSFGELPLLSWDAKTVPLHQLDLISGIYAKEFRETVGSCEADATKKRIPLSAEDLFCMEEP